MKNISVLLILVLVIGAFAGCSPATEPEDNAEPETTEEETDVVSAPSYAENEEQLKKAIGNEGTWIAYVTSDLTFDEELVLEGTFTNRDAEERKIALYEQDADRNVTARYTLTAPSLTVKSENTRLQGGTFATDVYVEANNVSVVDATVTGDVYFASEEYKDTFVVDENSTVEGEMIVEGADVVSSPSYAENEEQFKKAISDEGTWIAYVTSDLTFDEDLVLEGTFTNRDAEERKIGLYEQDADRNVTARYTLTAPSLTVKSENTRLQGGTFATDVYVEANNVSVVDATVTGDVYFASEAYKDTFVVDENSTVEGEMIVE